MKVKELRALLFDMPDDEEVRVSSGRLTILGIHSVRRVSPAMNGEHCVLLEVEPRDRTVWS